MSIVKEAWKEFVILIYWVFTYLDINIEVTTSLIVLMLVDTLIGTIKASIFKHKVTIKKLFSGLVTKVSILLLPFLLALVAKNVAPRYNFTGLVDTFLDIMLVSEFISILTNIISMKTKKEIKNFDLITRFLKGIRAYFVKFAKNLTIGIEDTDKKED